MKLVVTGTGRCGTTFTYDVLRWAGVDACIESRWSFLGHDPVIEHDAHVSMFAAPWVRHLDTPVVHLTRDPNTAIPALLGWRILDTIHQAHGSWYIKRHWRNCEHTPEDVAHYWCDWNEMCEQGQGPYMHVRLEDLSPDVFMRFPVPLHQQAVAVAYARAKREDYTAATARGEQFGAWDFNLRDLPAPVFDKVARSAERYGYEVAP